MSHLHASHDYFHMLCVFVSDDEDVLPPHDANTQDPDHAYPIDGCILSFIICLGVIFYSSFKKSHQPVRVTDGDEEASFTSVRHDFMMEPQRFASCKSVKNPHLKNGLVCL